MNFINFLKNLLHKLIGGNSGPMPTSVRANIHSEPRRGVIEAEPMVALKDGKLVVVLDYMFEDIPSWVEWDNERQVLSITQMGGQMDEVKVKIRKDYYETLEKSRKVLLVSNDNKENDEKIVHYVSFLARK